MGKTTPPLARHEQPECFEKYDIVQNGACKKYQSKVSLSLLVVFLSLKVFFSSGGIWLVVSLAATSLKVSSPTSARVAATAPRQVMGVAPPKTLLALPLWEGRRGKAIEALQVALYLRFENFAEQERSRICKDLFLVSQRINFLVQVGDDPLTAFSRHVCQRFSQQGKCRLRGLCCLLY